MQTLTLTGRRSLHSHDSEGKGGDLLIEQEHQGCGEDRLQEFGLQALEQAQHAIFPARVHSKPHQGLTFDWINWCQIMVTV